ncbi:hypothetical protein HK101_010999 [Irineochytrium annulatum]|nr:hypothetical protein HK101_010999 [Irineochytrium annulatum]
MWAGLRCLAARFWGNMSGGRRFGLNRARAELDRSLPLDSKLRELLSKSAGYRISDAVSNDIGHHEHGMEGSVPEGMEPAPSSRSVPSRARRSLPHAYDTVPPLTRYGHTAEIRDERGDEEPEQREDQPRSTDAPTYVPISQFDWDNDEQDLPALNAGGGGTSWDSIRQRTRGGVGAGTAGAAAGEQQGAWGKVRAGKARPIVDVPRDDDY